MAFSYGFYNSLNGDRKYDAEDMSRMFDGIITDGVLGSVGDTFAVKAGSGLQVTVGSGRAWFDHTWSYNDAAMQITLSAAEALLDRYDAIVLEVNNSSSARTNSIKVVKGTGASNPEKPTLSNTQYLHQYPFAYILRPAGSTTVTQGNIENTVGTSVCPLCTGPLTTMDFNQIISQWESQFNTWFNDLKVTLDSNTATNLKNQIDALTKKLPYVYSAKLNVSGWSEVASTNSMYEKGYRYTRMYKLDKENSSAPTTTGSSTFLPEIGFQSSGDAEKDEELAEALSIINKGKAQLLSNTAGSNGIGGFAGAGYILLYVTEKPTVEITVRWTIMS